jgi:hypothetical protein
MKFQEHLDSDRGISMVLVAMSMLLLLGASAIAIDLAAMRLDRSADQKVTDSAASAGALAALEGTGQDACEAALEYVAINSEGIDSIDTTGCSSIPLSCDPLATPPPSHSVSTGRFDITFTYPVPDSDDLMTSAQIGAPAQALVADDGEPCERVGVEMSATHESLFAQLLGFDEGTTTVHSVARSFIPPPDGPPLNLVVLDRFGTDGCAALVVSGNGGVIVEKVVDPATGDEYPGVAAADSDASAGCGGADPSVIRIDGSHGILRADGPPGCANEVSPGTGEGCGQIMSFAPGTPGCNPSACTPGSGGGNPPIPEEVMPMTSRLTRAQIDHEYNCWPNYAAPPLGLDWAVPALTVANQQDIVGCPGSGPAHIYELIDQVDENGTVAGFQNWSADLGHPCDVPSSNTAGIPISGNVRIDCPVFTVRGSVTITGGNVVFDNDVIVTAGTASNPTRLTIQNAAGSPGWAFFRDGILDKNGSAHLTFDNTAVYMSKDAGVTMSGGAGSLTWVAPNTGPFDDLALWSDSPTVHQWAGQANLVMEGVFFSPWAFADYAGTAGQNQTDAQWIADKLHARGQGQLVVTPKFEFPFKVDSVPRTTIIR